MGHNTPTNVLAWAEEQNTEQHKAIAVASFFTPHFPHHRLPPTRHDQASSAAIAPAPSKIDDTQNLIQKQPPIAALMRNKTERWG
jgi:hypothetical protein